MVNELKLKEIMFWDAAREIQKRHPKPLASAEGKPPPTIKDAADWYLARVIADYITVNK